MPKYRTPLPAIVMSPGVDTNAAPWSRFEFLNHFVTHRAGRVQTELRSLRSHPTSGADETRPSVTDPALRILTVCTGNICRSPVAERLLAAGLGARVAVGSAGTRAVVGAPIDPGMATQLDAAGVASDRFAARQLTAAQVRDADLVLALTRAHRARILDEVPAALRRTFTLLEFARIVASPDLPRTAGGSLGSLVETAARHRHLGDVTHGDDVPDPYGRGAVAFAESYALIDATVAAIIRSASPAT